MNVKFRYQLVHKKAERLRSVKVKTSNQSKWVRYTEFGPSGDSWIGGACNAWAAGVFLWVGTAYHQGAFFWCTIWANRADSICIHLWCWFSIWETFCFLLSCIGIWCTCHICNHLSSKGTLHRCRSWRAAGIALCSFKMQSLPPAQSLFLMTQMLGAWEGAWRYVINTRRRVCDCNGN